MLFFYILVFIAIVLAFVYLLLRNKLTTEVPKGFPQKGKIDRSIAGQKPLVVCAGDSITHGNTGVNYVEILEKGLPQYCFINAGRNADLTYTLLDRLDLIIEYQPDIVTVLIGTNDINSSMGQSQLKRYRDLKKIESDIVPTFESFQKNYTKIVKRLKTETKAKIAIASLPVISEDLMHEANQKADLYSSFIKELAQQENIGYLEVRETMKAYLIAHPKTLRYSYEDYYKLLNLSAMKHYVLGHSWDKISESIGNDLTQDNLHFNTLGATMIAELVQKFINNSNK